MTYRMCLALFASLLMSLSFQGFSQQVRVKDLVNIRGVRSNALIGYGVIFGLNQTGDSDRSSLTKKSVLRMLKSFGIDLEINELVTGTYASVMVTADLPAFAKNGDKIDVRVSANADATSLAGGTLLLTPLRSGDGSVYVVAQGPVILSGSPGAANQRSPIMTVGRVPRGGTVEKEFAPTILVDGKLQLSLKNPDFTTNQRITKEINQHFRGFYAVSQDQGSIFVDVPPPYTGRLVDLMAQIESLRVRTDRKATVVLNERTGTVVIGSDVRILPVVISHGELTIEVEKQVDANTEQTSAKEAFVPLKGATISELVKALNELGAKPSDVVDILQAIDKASALQGELIFI